MTLTRLDLHNFRAFTRLSVEPIPEINIVVGRNGSGKTSVLEAIHLLSSGRSFRTRQLTSMVRREQHFFAATGHMDAGAVSPVHISKRWRAPPEYKMGGNPVRTASQLSSNLPVQLFDRDSLNLVQAQPDRRRHFIDRGVFYMDATKADLFRRYRHAVRQRNRLLRTAPNAPERQAWEQLLVDYASDITASRQQWLAVFSVEFHRLLQACADSARLHRLFGDIEIALAPGYDTETPLLAQLRAHWNTDSAHASTSVGPHRADLYLGSSRQGTMRDLSSGEAKTLGCMLLLAQMACMAQHSRKQPVCLMDDMAAELDAATLELVLHLLAQTGDLQVFYTALDQRTVPSAWPRDRRTQTMHLETMARCA